MTALEAVRQPPAASGFGRTKPSVPPIASLALTSDRQHKGRVQLRHVAVQGNVAMRASADYKLALVSGRRTSDLGVGLQDVQRFDDLAHARYRVFKIMLGEVVEDSIKIINHLGGKLNADHRYRASLRAVGRRGFPPAARACRYERISGQGMVLPDVAIAAKRWSASA